MKAQDLIFHDIEGAPPDGSSDKVMFVVCSPACESVFRRDPKSDQTIARVLDGIRKMKEGEQWPNEV